MGRGVPASPSRAHATHEAPEGLRPSGFDPARVLFLDIDGVVLHGQALWATRNHRHLPPEKIALVKEVCDRTGAMIVVSSTWRFSDETADMLRAVGLSLHADWRTGYCNDMHGSIIMGQRRGVEIHRWLARHPEAIYAIIDDDSDMLPEQMDRFVKTPFETGIDRGHVEKLVSLLSDRDGTRSAETACPAPVPQDCQARADRHRPTTPPKDQP